VSPLPEQGAPALILVCFHPSSSFFFFYSQPPLSFPPSWAFCKAMFIVLSELPSLRVRRRLPAVFMLYLEFMPVQWHFTVAWPPIAATQVLSARYILLPPYAWTTPTVAQHANEPYSSGSSFLWCWWGSNYSITSNLVLNGCHPVVWHNKAYIQIFTSIHNNYCLTQLYFARGDMFRLLIQPSSGQLTIEQDVL